MEPSQPGYGVFDRYGQGLEGFLSVQGAGSVTYTHTHTHTHTGRHTHKSLSGKTVSNKDI